MAKDKDKKYTPEDGECLADTADRIAKLTNSHPLEVLEDLEMGYYPADCYDDFY